jgi:hypothetical protein
MIATSPVAMGNSGVPRTLAEMKSHNFVAVLEDHYAGPVSDWLRSNVPAERVVFRHNSLTSIYMSVKAGLGLSPCPDVLPAIDPDLVRCLLIDAENGKGLWLLAPERLRKTAHVRLLPDFLAGQLTISLKAAEARGLSRAERSIQPARSECGGFPVLKMCDTFGGATKSRKEDPAIARPVTPTQGSSYLLRRPCCDSSDTTAADPAMH